MVAPKFFVLYLIFSSALIYAEEDVKKSEHVITLNADNFDAARKQYNALLVGFLAPWCSACRHFAPAFAEAADSLKQQGADIQLVTVDCTVENSLCTQYNITYYPTVIFMRGDFSLHYTKGHLTKWVQKRLAPPTTSLNSPAEEDQFVESNELAAVGYFKDLSSEEARTFIDTATVYDDVAFGLVNHKDLEVPNAIILYHKFDDGQTHFDGHYTVASVTSFLINNHLPLFVKYSQDNEDRIFYGEPRTHVVVFIDDDAVGFKEKRLIIESLAREYRSQCRFIQITTQSDDLQEFLDFFGLKLGDFPTYRMITTEKGSTKIRKFKSPQVLFEQEPMKFFLNCVLAGTAKPYYLREKLPENWDAEPLKILTTENFHKVVYEDNKVVVVGFFSIAKVESESLLTVLDTLAGEFKYNADVVIAKMNNDNNELEEVHLEHVPVLKLFSPETDKAGKTYFGENELEKIRNFLSSHVANTKGEQVEREKGHDEL